MKYIIFQILLIFFIKTSFSQEIYSSKSEEKEEKYNYISFGWSNPISLTKSILTDDLNEKLGFYLDYSLNIEENKIVKIHIKTSPFYATQKLTLENFLVSIDYIKLITQRDKYTLGHGAGTYFRCNIYRSQPVAGLQTFWSSDFFGVGIQYHVFLDYELKDDLWINIITNLNLGLHQTYDNTINNGIEAQEIWRFKTKNQQLISIGIKKKF